MNDAAGDLSCARALTVIRVLETQKNLPKNRDRVPFHRLLHAELISDPTRPLVPVHARDLSAAGMSFVCRRPLRVQERFVIKLPYRNLPGKLALCVVEHCSYAAQGLHLVDVVFEEVQTLTRADSTVPPTWILRAKERRGA